MDDAILDYAVLLRDVAVCVRALQAEPDSVTAFVVLVRAVAVLQEKTGASSGAIVDAVAETLRKGGAE